MITDNDNAHRVILKEGRIAEILCGESSIVMDPDGITLTAKGGSSIALTEDNIDIEAGDGATISLDQNVDIDGDRIDLN